LQLAGGAVDTPDRIERELILPAARERVWAALTQAEGLSAWFGTAASIDLRPGGAVTFVWDERGGVRHTNPGLVEIVEAPHRFAFRWRPFEGYEHLPLTEGPTTRVEFTLEPHPAGTRLRLVESGFASLPGDLRGPVREGNVRGWQRELGELVAYLASGSEPR
jgi:uncharacterized protein YndB with AHSA1/START domain